MVSFALSELDMQQILKPTLSVMQKALHHL